MESSIIECTPVRKSLLIHKEEVTGLTALPNRPTVSIEEYLQLDQDSKDIRYEHSDGNVTMLAGGTLDHSKIGFNVARTLFPVSAVYENVVFEEDEQ